MVVQGWSTRLHERDAAYLWDIVNAVRELTRFLAGKPFSDLTSDRVLRLAVERELEIIGEAARRVSQGFRDEHAEVPWSSIIGLRNVLAHEYGDVKLERIWVIATERVPELAATLEPLIPPVPDDQ